MCIDVVCIVDFLASGGEIYFPHYSEQSVDFNRCSRGNLVVEGCRGEAVDSHSRLIPQFCCRCSYCQL